MLKSPLRATFELFLVIDLLLAERAHLSDAAESASYAASVSCA